MSDRSNARIVYSTVAGETCPTCGWPKGECRCSSMRQEAPEPVRGKLVAKLRMEKKGRGGKTVSVVYDLPRNERVLKALCQELKRACGTGGTVQDDTIELQGDLRDRLREVLAAKGYTVKG